VLLPIWLELIFFTEVNEKGVWISSLQKTTGKFLQQVNKEIVDEVCKRVFEE
jgi:hypothetical protein